MCLKSLFLSLLAIGLETAYASTPKVNVEMERKYFDSIRCKTEVFEELSSMLATREWSLPSRARSMDREDSIHLRRLSAFGWKPASL